MHQPAGHSVPARRVPRPTIRSAASSCFTGLTGECSTMVRYAVDCIRNIVLAGHGAVGKTTLADRMLYKAGKNTRPGCPDDGTSLLDTDDDEKERKHSVTSHLAHFDHNGCHVNLIDSPGYPDFIGHTISGLDAVETAVVVISATAGIEVNTRRAFQLAEEYGKARMIVINKVDGDNVD